MRETCHAQELTITCKSLGLFWKSVTLNNLKRLLLKTLMGEFRIQNNTVDRFLIRSSPQAISSGSNVSTHFNVKIPSQCTKRWNSRVAFLILNNISSPLSRKKRWVEIFHSQFYQGSDALSSIPLSALLPLQVVRIKKAALEFFPFR